MANEGDSVKSSSFAIFIMDSSYPGMRYRYSFSQKRICIYQKTASSIYYVSGTKNS